MSREPKPAAGVEPAIAAMEGRAAMPRRNGELVFEAPWQGRAFGLGVALCERGLYPWREFQQSLIDVIGMREGEVDPRAYYEQWLAALERLLVAKGVLSGAEIERRAAEFLSGERDQTF